MWGSIRSDTVGKMTFLKISSPMLESQWLNKFWIWFYKILDISIPNIRENIILQFKEFKLSGS